MQMCRGFYWSDGTRTRDLRRDRPSWAQRRPATNASEQAHFQVLSALGVLRTAWLSQSSNRRLGYERATKSCLHGQRRPAGVCSEHGMTPAASTLSRARASSPANEAGSSLPTAWRTAEATSAGLPSSPFRRRARTAASACPRTAWSMSRTKSVSANRRAIASVSGRGFCDDMHRGPGSGSSNRCRASAAAARTGGKRPGLQLLGGAAGNARGGPPRRPSSLPANLAEVAGLRSKPQISLVAGLCAWAPVDVPRLEARERQDRVERAAVGPHPVEAILTVVLEPEDDPLPVG